jgi:hypothetical protein
MRTRPLAPLLALLLGACSQTLTVKVLRYDVDADGDARQKYAEARRALRPAGKAREQVSSAQLALARYKGCLRSLNVLVQDLLPGLPDAARTAAKANRSRAIDAAFQSTEAALAKMEGQLAALPPDSPAPPFQALPVRFSDLREQLERATVETDPAALRNAAAQLQKLPAAELAQRGRAADAALGALLDDRSVSCLPADASRYLAELSSATPRATAARDPFAAALDTAKIRLAADLERARTGDLVPRPYGVWQDLTDPFLMFIVAHPDNWRTLVESTNVDGQGDTEYVLVFESPLDARLKTVTVDPSQVIQARLSIARKVAQAAVAATGLATSSFGVRLPTPASASLGGGKEGAADTIDFSRMTADEQVTRERNSAEQRRIERLKHDAARLRPVTDPESARRALEFLRRELDNPDPAPAGAL